MGALVDIGGYRLHWYATGQGKPTVVFLSGAGDFSFDWSLVQSEVSKFTRACSYDRAGLAWSDLGPTPRTMKQEAYELHLLLRNAGLKGPYVLVGHSVGGLIARVYVQHYRSEVAGLVLVDSTHEDTTLMLQGKLVRIRENATGRSIPPVQTMKTSPPKPPTDEDRKRAEFNAGFFGPPTIEPPFDKLPPEVQKTRLWMLNHPKLAAASDDFWAEELQNLYIDRAHTPYPLGELPLVVLVATGPREGPPPNLSSEEWNRLSQEKLDQKAGLAELSRDSLLVRADKSGHHIQLDQPDLVVDAIRRVVDAVRSHRRLSVH